MRPRRYYIVTFRGGVMRAPSRWKYYTKHRAEYVARFLQAAGCVVRPVTTRTGAKARSIPFGSFTDRVAGQKGSL